MKVLFTNHILDATIAADTPNTNYPASNIQSQFLEKKFKSAGRSDVITITLPDTASGNCFWYGYSNVDYMQVAFYSSSSMLVGSQTLNCTYSSGSIFFTSLPNVRTIVVTAQSPANEDLYIGGLGFGTAFDFPYPSASFAREIFSNETKETSDYGQTSVRYIKPLDRYSLQFLGVQRSEYHDIISAFKDIGSGHLWLDISEDNHAAYQPLYCTSKMIESPSRDETISFKITFTEAR